MLRACREALSVRKHSKSRVGPAIAICVAALVAACADEGEFGAGEAALAKEPAYVFVPPPPPPPELIIRNDSQFDLVDVRLHLIEGYSDAEDIMEGRGLAVGEKHKMAPWKGPLSVTVMRPKVEFGGQIGPILAMTTAQAVPEYPDDTVHVLKVFDQSFRLAGIAEFPRPPDPEDRTPPSFEGIKRVDWDFYKTAYLFWPYADDEVTPGKGITYKVCRSKESGACVKRFEATYTAPTGRAWLSVAIASPGEYFFVVRATDESGNTEANEREASLVVPPPRRSRPPPSEPEPPLPDPEPEAPPPEPEPEPEPEPPAPEPEPEPPPPVPEPPPPAEPPPTPEPEPPPPVPVVEPPPAEPVVVDDAFPTSVSFAFVIGPEGSQVSAGGRHTCLLRTGSADAPPPDENISCWGSNDFGQLGDGTTENRGSEAPVSGLAAALRVETGRNHTCALLLDGRVSCWGRNDRGQLGDGTTVKRLLPGFVSGMADVFHLAAGAHHSCVILSDRTVRCWGANQAGQLGDGSDRDGLAPVSVTGMTDVKAIAGGAAFSCAVMNDGTVNCWGRNTMGQIGIGGANLSQPATAVSSLSGVTAITAGDEFVCALKGDGSTWCWGRADRAQLGTRDSEALQGCSGVLCSTVPTTTSSLSSLSAIDAGAEHVCGVDSAKRVTCWGWNGSGQLGRTSISASGDEPAQVEGVSDAVSVSAGDRHTCALDSKGTLYCWGSDASGRLGPSAAIIARP